MSYHVVTEVVKSKLIVCSVCNIAEVSLTSFIVGESVEDTADGKTEPAENFTHFLCLSFSKVIVNGYNVNAFSGECIEIRSDAGNESFTFTSSHFSDTSLMKNDSTDYLNRVRLLFENTPCTFSDGSERLREDIIESFAGFQSVFEFLCLSLEFSIREFLILLIKSENFILNRLNTF